MTTYIVMHSTTDDLGRPGGWHIAGYKKSPAEDAKNVRARIRKQIRAKLDALGVGNNDFPSREAAEAVLARF
jgi:hypothetical protein